jgi:hypothetical protein
VGEEFWLDPHPVNEMNRRMILTAAMVRNLLIIGFAPLMVIYAGIISGSTEDQIRWMGILAAGRIEALRQLLNVTIQLGRRI